MYPVLKIMHMLNFLDMFSMGITDCAFTVVFVSSQCLVLEHICRGIKVYIAGVYANNSYILQRQLWADLTSLQNTY